MQLTRPIVASNPGSFGRGLLRELPAPSVARATISADLKLFATTFIAGFVFVSVLIA